MSQEHDPVQIEDVSGEEVVPEASAPKRSGKKRGGLMDGCKVPVGQTPPAEPAEEKDPLDDMTPKSRRAELKRRLHDKRTGAAAGRQRAGASSVSADQAAAEVQRDAIRLRAQASAPKRDYGDLKTEDDRYDDEALRNWLLRRFARLARGHKAMAEQNAAMTMQQKRLQKQSVRDVLEGVVQQL